MIIRRKPDIPSSEITPESVYLNRRSFVKTAAAAGVIGSALGPQALAGASRRQEIHPRFATLSSEMDEPLNTYEEVTTYNNFYEFGTRKSDPAENADGFRPRPWKVEIGGLVNKPGEYDLDDLLSGITMEDRVYRLRCVEAWSMVIPWYGFPLSALINKVEPQPGAKYIEIGLLEEVTRWWNAALRSAGTSWSTSCAHRASGTFPSASGPPRTISRE